MSPSAQSSRRFSGRSAYAALTAVFLGLTLNACSMPALSTEGKCGEASACAKALEIPTSDQAQHTDGLLTGIAGTLTARREGDKVCLQLRPDAGEVINLRLPKGYEATAHGRPVEGGGPAITIIGPSGLGGIQTGERVVLTPDHEQKSAQVGICPQGRVIDTGWIIRLNE